VEDDEEATGATRDEATVDYSLRLGTLRSDIADASSGVPSGPKVVRPAVMLTHLALI
jgi:hypothetical protein